MTPKLRGLVEALKLVPDDDPLSSATKLAVKLIEDSDSVKLKESDSASQTGAQLASLYTFRADLLKQRRGLKVTGLANTVERLAGIHQPLFHLTVEVQDKTISVYRETESGVVVGCLVFPPAVDAI